MTSFKEQHASASSPDEPSSSVDPNLIPVMKPLPDELQFGREMVLSVALEMEEKRRQMSKKVEGEEGGNLLVRRNVHV
jgi:ABC-type histidine transport system ATPase subunit